MEVVGEKLFNEVRFLECSCSCGGNFYALAEDIESGAVSSCGHQYAGMDLERLYKKRITELFAGWTDPINRFMDRYREQKSIGTLFREGRETAIRLKAYLLWETDGCPDGRDWEFWFAAEKVYNEPPLL